MPELLDGLNPKQREAAQCLEGPLLILAGAGSGKTRTITYRIANLLQNGVSPNNVMAVTFTNKAAQEMKSRIEQILGVRARGLVTGTFHAICVRILRKDGEALGIDPNFTIFDEADQTTLMREILSELNLDEKRHPPRVLLSAISSAKNRSRNFSSHPPFGHFEEILAQVYPMYQKKLRALHAFDFDDLLLETVRLFMEQPKIREKYETLFRYLLVDEYQDVNFAQYRLVKILSENHRNLCVVGDDDQSIYSFRGADVELILRFEKDFPDAKVVRLEQNYRSTSTILNAANAVVAGNKRRKPKQLWTENPPGEKILLFEALNEKEEGRFVVEEILKLVRRENRSLKDFAVLYRTNAQSRAVEEAFLQAGLPYQVIGGVRFYDRKEIKDILAYLKVIVNPYDAISLRRALNVPPRGIGSATLKRLEDFAGSKGEGLFYALSHIDEIPDIKGKAKQGLTQFAQLLSELSSLKKEFGLTYFLKSVLQKSGYLAFLEEDASAEGTSRLENCQELLTVAQEFEKNAEDNSLEAFLYHVSLLSDVDTKNESKEAVTLMTLHSAKGLEFPVVFLVGMEEGIFPHNRSLLDESNIEEERRLCYVGITRAMEKLYLLCAFERTLFGVSNFGEPSRFLAEIPKECYIVKSQRDSVTVRSTWEETGFALRLRPGDRLQHEKWGKGVVIQRQNGHFLVAFEKIGLKQVSFEEVMFSQ
jgi:DNA helicase-2/ATP-dependent DNA helicase PcrA